MMSDLSEITNTIAGKDAFLDSDSSGRQGRTGKRHAFSGPFQEDHEGYRIFLENLGDGVIILDWERRFISANRAAHTIFALPEGDLVERKIDEFISPEYLGIFNGRWEKHKTGENRFRYDLEIVRSDGQKRFLLVSDVSRYDKKGRFIGSLCALTDLTERENTQRELMDSERLLQRVFDAIPDLFMVLNKDCRVELSSWNNIDHVPQENQKPGLTCCDLSLHNKDDGICHVQEVFKTGKTREFEHVNPLNGQTRDIRAFPIFDENGEVWKVTVHIRNVTEQKRIQREYLKLGTAVEQAAESILITNPAGKTEYVNPTFEKQSGYSKEEMIDGRPDFLLGKSREGGDPELSWERILSKEKWSGRLTAQTKENKDWETETTISPVHDEEGNLVNYVFLIRDITRELEIENRLRQTQKMEAIGSLAAGIAHDFNNILFAVLGYTELAIADLPRGSQTRKNLKQVTMAGQRAVDLVGQILTFARQTEQERIPLQLHPVIEEALILLRGSLPASIEFRKTIDPNCGHVLADPTQVHQVLMNLCTNASHAMREDGGVLEVSLNEVELSPEYTIEYPDLKPGRYARLVVADTGQGMNKETMKRIFEPYFTTKKVGEGSGFGLSTVHGIVKNHEGEILVESEPGQGTTFQVFFPIHQKPRLVQKENCERRISHRGKGERILFVDDEEAIVMLMKENLKKLGYSVEGYTDSVLALDGFRSDPDRFDLVITDQTMPKMTGSEMIGQIRNIRPDIPVIQCSGLIDDIREPEEKGKAPWEYIRKPFNTKIIADALQRVLNGKRNADASPAPRILVIDEDERVRAMLRMILKEEGYAVREALDAGEGIKLFRKNPFDLTITDISKSEKGDIEAMMELRRDFPDARIIGTSESESGESEGYRDIVEQLGLLRTLHKPIGQNDLVVSVRESIGRYRKSEIGA